MIDGHARVIGLVENGKVIDASYKQVATAKGQQCGEAGAALLALKEIDLTKPDANLRDYRATLQPPTEPVTIVTHRPPPPPPPDPPNDSDRSPLLTCFLALFVVGFAVMAIIAAAIAVLLTTPVWLGSVIVSLVVTNMMVKRYWLGEAEPGKAWKQMQKGFLIKRHALLLGFVYGACLSGGFIAFGSRSTADIVIWLGSVAFGTLVSSRVIDPFSQRLIRKLSDTPVQPSSAGTVNVVRRIQQSAVPVAAVALFILGGSALFAKSAGAAVTPSSPLVTNSAPTNPAWTSGWPAPAVDRLARSSAAPAIPPLATDAGPTKGNRGNSSTDWDTVKIAELGDVYIMVPPRIDRKYSFKRSAEGEHVEFHAIGGQDPTIVIDVSPKGKYDDLSAHAYSLRNSLAKAYYADYHEEFIRADHKGVDWEFDLTRHGVTLRKNDYFEKLQLGRTAAIMMSARPEIFEQFKMYLSRLHRTLSEGYMPDP